MSKAKELYDEWKKLKLESINYQRAGIDGEMSDQSMGIDAFIHKRIKEIEPLLFPFLTERSILTYHNTPVKDAEKEQDIFYNGNYLVDWVKVFDSLIVTNNLVSGQIIYAKKPLL